MNKATFAQVSGAILLPQLGGFVNGKLTRNNIETWYNHLKFPSWKPPNYIFAPMWITLYSGMGYASYLVWRDGNGFGGDAKLPLILYGTQLALNWAWTPIFFKYHSFKWSAIEITALTAAATATGVAFFGINKVAGLLFIPYVAWLSFATALNYRISRDNMKEIKDKDQQ